jgi:radical SAM superfamily enzyme YgiQ (UPF0313 family)
MAMNILIIATNQERFPFAVAPLGAAHLVSILEQEGHTVHLLDLCFTRHVERTVKKSLHRIRPDLIGLSVRNLDNCGYPRCKTYYRDTKRIFDIVKGHSDATMVAGGSGISVMQRDFCDFLEVPFALVGEGEESLPAFVRALENRRDLTGIPGLMTRTADGWRVDPPGFSVDVDQVPVHAFSRIDYPRYFKSGGFIGMQTKRGCPFRCVYCNYPNLEGSRTRLRSPGLCVADMERMVKETGLRDFFFTDGVFNWPRHHALTLCEEILRRDLRIRWMAYCNPQGLDDEMARAFKAAGCAGLELGLDAVTEEMINGMGKGFTQQDIVVCYQALIRAGLPFAVFLLFGGPGDSYQNMEESQHFLKSLGKASAVFASLGIRIYRDTPIHDIALQEGVIAPERNLLEPVFYVSHRLEADIFDRLDRLARREATWSTPTDWNSAVVGMIQRILGRFRVIPAWRDIEAYGAHMRRSC